MRYTEEKETKNISKSQAVTANILWDRSAYSSFLAIFITAALSVGKSLLIGSRGPGFRLSRLWPLSLFQRHRVTLRRLIIKSVQVRVIEIPASLALSIVAKILSLCSWLNHRLFISPTNPLSFFFLRPPVQQIDQLEHVPFPQAHILMRHTLPGTQSSFLPLRDLLDAQGRLLSLSGVYGLNLWNISLRGVRSRLQDFRCAGFLKIFDIFSLGINIVVFFFLQKIFYLLLYSWYTPFRFAGNGLTPVALRAPSVTPSRQLYHVV